MTEKTKALIAAIALLTAYAAGRFTSPVKIVKETQTSAADKKTQDSDTDRTRHRDTTTVVVQSPDGKTTTTTHIVDDANTDSRTKTVDDAITRTQSRTETTYQGSKVTLSALGGLAWDLTPVYGVMASKELIGPIGVGAWGLTDRTFGVSLSLTF